MLGAPAAAIAAALLPALAVPAAAATALSGITGGQVAVSRVAVGRAAVGQAAAASCLPVEMQEELQAAVPQQLLLCWCKPPTSSTAMASAYSQAVMTADLLRLEWHLSIIARQQPPMYGCCLLAAAKATAAAEAAVAQGQAVEQCHCSLAATVAAAPCNAVSTGSSLQITQWEMLKQGLCQCQ